ncbi:MAG: RDD family protein [Mycobacteriales bacterium]|nr:RDD family protein [Mycobacteriales bacterium]
MSQLVTGEAVALDLRPAGLPSRLLASGIDLVILGVLYTAVAAVFLAVGVSSSSAATAALTITSFVLVFLGVPVACETLFRGRTPGKAALGLRVVRDDGGPVAFRQSFVRGLVGLFVEKPGFTFGLVAVVTSLLNERGKRLGDLLAGTMVLQERVAVTRGPVATMPPQLTAWAETLDLAGVPEPLLLSVRQFVARSSQLTDAARATLGSQLVATVLAVTSPPPPPGTPGWAVLSAVLAERRRREEARQSGYTPAPRETAPTPTLTPTLTPTAPPTPHPPSDTGFALPQ